MKVIIDRFEGNYAVCQKEDMSMVNIEKRRIPVAAKEGDVLILSDKCISIDKEETERLKKQMEKISEDIWE